MADQVASTPAEPISQGVDQRRKNWPVWAKQLPTLKDSVAKTNFQLIDPTELDALLKDADPAVVKRIHEDIAFMDHELLRLFRDADYESARQQNRYRLYQILYIVLAAVATLLGSLQAIFLTANRSAMPWFAFLETVVALLATYLSTISGREPPLPLWLSNRRVAETLRREYFRFVANLPPYEMLDGPERRRILSKRAADVYRGQIPEEY